MTDFMRGLPHGWILVGALAGAVFLMVWVGCSLARRMWSDYRKRYEEGAAVTMDALYLSMPPQTVLYLGALAGLLGVAAGWLATGYAGVGVALGLAGFFAPRVALTLLRRRRERMFQEQLVDALMNISNGMRAGFSLPQALELLQREAAAPMGQEMRLVCQELRLGVPVEEALARLYRRMPSADMDLVVTAVDIVRDVGGNLTEVFDNIAGTIRERQRLEGKLRALTAQGRMQSWVMAALPVALAFLMYLIAPEIFAMLFTTGIGWAMVGTVLVLIVLGLLWIRYIVRIDI